MPLEEVIKRDVKGLYQKAPIGKIPNLTGVTDPYEPPLKPDITVNTSGQSVAESLETILRAPGRAGLIRDSVWVSPGRLSKEAYRQQKNEIQNALIVITITIFQRRLWITYELESLVLALWVSVIVGGNRSGVFP